MMMVQEEMPKLMGNRESGPRMVRSSWQPNVVPSVVQEQKAPTFLPVLELSIETVAKMVAARTQQRVFSPGNR